MFLRLNGLNCQWGEVIASVSLRFTAFIAIWKVDTHENNPYHRRSVPLKFIVAFMTCSARCILLVPTPPWAVVWRLH